jgi:BTB And C-terminal Kelch/BTB/POZ domain
MACSSRSRLDICLYSLINYAYTSEMSIEQKNVQALLAAATFLDITPVRDACCSFMERNMDESNCLMIHCFAEMHSCTCLAEKAKTFALQRFPSVSHCSEFLEMTKEKVRNSSLELFVDHFYFSSLFLGIFLLRKQNSANLTAIAAEPFYKNLM